MNICPRLLPTLVLGTHLLVLGAAASAPTPTAEDHAGARGDTPSNRVATVPVIQRLRYVAAVADDQLRVVAELEVESSTRAAVRLPLFGGDVVVLPGKLPAGVRLTRDAAQYAVEIQRAGRFPLRFELVVRVQAAERWREAAFTGPAATIATLEATAKAADTELELVSGTALEPERDPVRVRGVLGPDARVALRWRDRAVVSTQPALMTCETEATLRVTPMALQIETQFQFDVRLGSTAGLSVGLPSGQALTRVHGDGIRDWQVTTNDGRPVLEIAWLRPVTNRYVLRLWSEQALEGTPGRLEVEVPEPRGVQRESGRWCIQAEDVALGLRPGEGLRAVAAAEGAVAAYRFHRRPAVLGLEPRRLEPVLQVAEQFTVRVEEHRVLRRHRLALHVEQAGLYALELGPVDGAEVGEVTGEGVEGWSVRDGTLAVRFGNRVTGDRRVEVLLEQPRKEDAATVALAPMRVTGAARHSTRIEAGAVPGLLVKTARLDGLREQPVGDGAAVAEVALAFQTARPDWALELSVERLAPRVVAEVFHLVTVGDGLLGGSTTVRYAILNQGVQAFRLRVPATWRNVEFTGPNIRRKDRTGDEWTLTLQDKVWGGYTLVVTYDVAFEPNPATLVLGGLHALDVERETGSLAVTSAGGLQLRPLRAGEGLRRIDAAELASADRALVTHAVLLAYRYTEPETAGELAVEARRYETSGMLAAVADRTQLTTVLTEDGQMLSQATFMVKNHDKQFQRFTLPAGAQLWSSFVNGAPVKAEQDGADLRVPLPRGLDRDQVFAVELVYAQHTESLRSWRPRHLSLQAPETDVQTTFAEWELYAPAASRLRRFQGSMRVADRMSYTPQDAWFEFTDTYRNLVRSGRGVLVGLGVLVLAGAMIGAAFRRGWHGVLTMLGVFCGLVILGGMLLPSLAKAKAKSQRLLAINNLKQIGLAARVYATDNRDAYPASFDQMRNELGTDKVTIDPESGRRFIYLGALVNETMPQAVLAYAPESHGGVRAVVLADGSAQQLREEQFQEALQRTLTGAGRGAPPRQAAAPVSTAAWSETASATAPEAHPAALDASLPPGAGLRPVRIDLPLTGHRLVFTKVLNVRREPLSIQSWVVRNRLWNLARSGFEVGTFLIGLALAIREWRRGRPRTLALATGMALAGAGVVSLLLATRLLGVALIVAAPLGVLLPLALLGRRYWHRAGRAQPTASGGVAPALPIVLLAVCVPVSQVAASSRGMEVAEPATAVIESAVYTGTVREHVAELEAEFQLRADTGPSAVDLFVSDTPVRDFVVVSGEARLVRREGAIAVRLSREGTSRVKLAVWVRPSGDATRHTLGLPIPAALLSRLDVRIDEPEAGAECPGAVTVHTAAEGSKTRVEALLGATDRLELHWTPRLKRAADVAATAFCRSASRVVVEAGLMRVSTRYTYEVTQGELREVRLQLPPAHRLVRVSGDRVLGWRLGADQVLGVAVGPTEGSVVRLDLDTEQSVPDLPASVEVRVPRPLEVQRETGWIGLVAGDELGLSPESVTGLVQGDGSEFVQVFEGGGSRGDAGAAIAAPADGGPGITQAYQFLRPGFELRVRAEALQPQVECVVRHQFTLGHTELRLESQCEYSIQRAGVFGLRLTLPDGYRVERVAGGVPPAAPEPLRWTERRGTDPGVLEVELPRRTLGAFRLEVGLERVVTAWPGELEAPVLAPIEVGRLSGFVLVTTEPGVQAKTLQVNGLTEVPTTAVPGGVAGLAFKLATVTSPAAGWALRLATERSESWVRAEAVHWLGVGEGWLSGRAVVRFEVQNAPTREFRLRVPAAFRNVEITSPQLRRRDRDGEVWRLELQHRVTGHHSFTVTWDQPWPLAANGQSPDFAVAGVQALDVERETGLLAVVPRTQVEILPGSETGELRRIDTSEIPVWAGAPDSPPVLAFRYLRPTYRLTLSARRFEPAVLLQALVNQARLTTVMAEDGQLMTEVSFAVRNHGEQFLDVVLPPGSEVWSAFVAGQPVRPALREGHLLLPLERSAAGQLTVPVEFTYVAAAPFPRGQGHVALESPTLTLPVKNARWELYLPPEYDYGRFGGTMSHEAGVARVVGAFSRDEYSQAESLKHRDRQVLVSNSLLEVQQKLATGQLEDANRAYSKARRAGVPDGQADLQALEQALRQAQAGNLRRAQETLFSNAQTPGARLAPAAAESYDPGMAAQQWSKLQQAQDVAAATVRPLRVNLPTRGLRFSFAQALQTVPGKPLRIEFQASPARSGGWLAGLSWVLLGLMVVAALAHLAARAKGRSAPAGTVEDVAC